MIIHGFVNAGVSRDEETLLRTVYLNKLPDKFPEGSRVFVVDSMLATGGIIVAALNLLKECGIENKHSCVLKILEGWKLYTLTCMGLILGCLL
ncbi:uracil phosphoribosyltransferase [Herrania umbratica]|uniref:uracil phosphoribosyltransferase n=1 Tax=Herrania umbratica TaxID=108875 RepID=A0A6J1B715_9ROSI|nr:uracil phosphoribosyltransferase [Herrania umbratica]